MIGVRRSHISPVQVVGSVSCDDGHWDVKDVIDGQLETENMASKTKSPSDLTVIHIQETVLQFVTLCSDECN